MAKAAGSEPILSLKITLRGIRPRIWRRLVMPAASSLGDLHFAIQAAMGWDTSHLHVFKVGREHYGDPEFVDEVSDEERLTLAAVRRSGINRFLYTYDFGDDWEHDVLIEKRAPRPDPAAPEVCVAGARKCPPEDCGGVFGYYDLLDALADPGHPGHAERLEWLEGAFDPEAFDLDAVNRRLAAHSRRD